MGLFKFLKDVVIITAAVAAVSTVAAPLWLLANGLDDEEIQEKRWKYEDNSRSMCRNNGSMRCIANNFDRRIIWRVNL